MNIERAQGFSQVVVWPDTVVGEDNVDDFLKFMSKEFGIDVQYLEEIETFPDRDADGEVVEGTGGRNDLFFAVGGENIGSFAIKRLAYGMRWIEDVYGNDGGYLYPERVREYCSWRE